MKRKQARTLKLWINSFAWITLISTMVYMGFIRDDDPTSFSQGRIKGGIYFLLFFVLLIIALTVHNTKKNGGSWEKVGKNLRRNFAAVITSVPFGK